MSLLLGLLLCVCGDPTFIHWPKVREFNRPNLGSVLNDIESHMPAGHQYAFPSMPMTWAHETTHGIHSRIRMAHRGRPRRSGFYVLQDRAVLIVEPSITLRQVAPRVPVSLRGPSYDLYLIRQAAHWNDTPTMICDEWVAYTNGVACAQQPEIDESGWHYELLQAHNFNVYALTMAMVVAEKQPDYDAEQLRRFIKFNIERVYTLTETPLAASRRATGRDATPYASSRAYMEKVRTAQDAAELRAFAKGYLGEDWCKNVMGF